MNPTIHFLIPKLNISLIILVNEIRVVVLIHLPVLKFHIKTEREKLLIRPIIIKNHLYTRITKVTISLHQQQLEMNQQLRAIDQDIVTQEKVISKIRTVLS